VLDEETELQEIVQLVGKDALPDDQQLTLEVARYLREAYLQQNAFHPVDTFCPPEKTYLMLTTIETFNDEAFDALEAGVPVEDLVDTEAAPGSTGSASRRTTKSISRSSKRRSPRNSGASTNMKRVPNYHRDQRPLVYAEVDEAIGYDEIVEIETAQGETLRGQVLESSEGVVAIQVFEGTSGIDQNASVRFLGETMKMPVTEDLLGRVLDGSGRPIDDGPEIVPEERQDIVGAAINPYSREYPEEFIETGVSAIDGMNTLVRGQKLPIFSSSGQPHSQLAMQIARQASVPEEEEGGDDEEGSEFAVIFGAMGITAEEANEFMQDFERTGALERSVVFMNLADDPAVERTVTPRMVLTTAEYLAFEGLPRPRHPDGHDQLLRSAPRSGRLARRSRVDAATPGTCTPTWRSCTSAPAGFKVVTGR